MQRSVLSVGWVSRVYVNTVVPFQRVLAISSPLTQWTQGIMGIKEWNCVTLASRSHSSLSASHWSAVFVWEGCAGNACAVHYTVSKNEREKSSHINTTFKGKPESMDHLLNDTLVLSLASSQTEQLRSKNYMEAYLTMCWDTDTPQDEVEFQRRVLSSKFCRLVCLYQPIN